MRPAKFESKTLLAQALSDGSLADSVKGLSLLESASSLRKASSRSIFNRASLNRPTQIRCTDAVEREAAAQESAQVIHRIL